LVQEALRGEEKAWLALIARYKNLIYSIALRYNLSRDDSVDVFHSVVAELLSGLGRLRQPQALQAWLIQVASPKCLEVKRRYQREGTAGEWEAAEQHSEEPAPLPQDQLERAQKEQMLRRSLDALAPQCRRLVQMLFYETPSRSYMEVAAALGMAIGSIGLTRRRCLERLRKLLDNAGYA